MEPPNTAELPQTTAKVLQDYSQNSTIHCVKYIATGESRGRRIFWAVLLFVSVTALLYTLFSQLAEMLTYPSTMSFIVNMRAEQIFPAVTICNLNTIRLSEVEKYPGLAEALENTLNPTGVPTADDQFYFANVSEEKAFQVRNMSHPLNDSLLSCVWAGHKLPCHQLFEMREADLGMCYTFNQRSPALTKPYMSLARGESTGLVVRMNAMQDEYVISDTSYAVGFRISLHDFEDTPVPGKDSFIVSPGFSTEVKIKLREIHYLPYPFKAYGPFYCAQTWEKGLKYFHRYDTNACFMECKIDYIIQRCGCRGIYDPDTVRIPFCSSEVYSGCYTTMNANFWVNQTVLRSCNCPPTCTQRLYDASLSMAYFPSDILTTENNGTFTDLGFGNLSRKNHLEVKLHYTSGMVEKVEQIPVYTFESIIATLGGQLGAYIGASVLSLVELGESLALCIRIAWRRVCVTRQMRRGSAENRLELYNYR